MKEWYDRNYRLLMLGFMAVEISLLIYLCVLETMVVKAAR